MLTFIRRRLTFANIALTVALLLAMSGGAYAASKYIITSTKQISPKVLKQLRGATGATGSQGPQGLQGKEGAAGKNGTNGTNGTDGKDGTAGKDGTNGESVTNTPLASGNANCAEGGAELTVGSGTPTYACNGESATGFLKQGHSEYGTWSATISASEYPGVAGEFAGFAPIRFSPEVQSTPKVHYLARGEETTECKGSESSPEATEGNLCLYGLAAIAETEFFTATPKEEFGTVAIFLNPKPVGFVWGTWALTAE